MATFKAFLEAFEQTVSTKGPFPVDTPWPTDDEIGDYALKVALEWAAPEAGVLGVLSLGTQLAAFIAKGRDRYTEGDLEMLRGIHGSRQGGGKNASLKVPSSDRHLVSESLLAEYDKLPTLQKKVGNDLAKGKINAEALIIMGEFQGVPREIALKK
jgi:hypothetical protein